MTCCANCLAGRLTGDHLIFLTFRQGTVSHWSASGSLTRHPEAPEPPGPRDALPDDRLRACLEGCTAPLPQPGRRPSRRPRRGLLRGDGSKCFTRSRGTPLAVLTTPVAAPGG